MFNDPEMSPYSLQRYLAGIALALSAAGLSWLNHNFYALIVAVASVAVLGSLLYDNLFP
jgi:hypothetical protein